MNTRSPNLGSHTPTQETLEDVLFQAKSLIDELEPVNQAKSQLSVSILSRVSLVTAVLICIIAAYGFVLDLREVAHPLVSFLSAAALAITSALLWNRQAFGKITVVGITIGILLLTAITVYFNGVYPLYFLPVILIFLHSIGSPQLALPTSLAVLILASFVFFSNGQDIEFRVATRLLASSLICLVVFQALSRHNRRVFQAAEYVTSRLEKLVNSLEADLRQTMSERDFAKTRNSNSGLLNIFGFHEKLSQRIHESSLNQPLAVVIVQFPPSDFILSAELLDDSDKGFNKLVVELKTIFEPELIGHPSRWEFMGVMKVQAPHEEFINSIVQRLDVISKSLTLGDGTKSIPYHVGIAIWPDNGLLPRVLTSRANRALLHAIDMDLRKPLVYGEDIEVLISRKRDLVASLQGAFERNEFELFYQPIVGLSPKGLCGAEALVRWNHPVQGLLFPGAFLHLLESHGYMIELTHFCLQSAAQTVKQWRESIAPNFQISVNIPPMYLAWCSNHRSDALEFFKSLDVDPEAIKLEITEDSLMDVNESTLDVLAELKSKGFLLALDDFGTGYSSFGRMKDLPLDAIKIDKSLVDDLEHSPKNLRVCTAIIHLGHEFGFQVVAEGVEHIAQKELLEKAGCDFIQGYLYSKPIDKNSFESYAANF